MKSTLDRTSVEPKAAGNPWKMATIALAILSVLLFAWALSMKGQSSAMHSGSSMHDGAGMASNLGPADAEYDKRFIDQMIPHHEGAVMMGHDALNKAQHQELKDMARNIIDAQEKEINQLRNWRQKWYGFR